MSDVFPFFLTNEQQLVGIQITKCNTWDENCKMGFGNWKMKYRIKFHKVWGCLEHAPAPAPAPIAFAPSSAIDDTWDDLLHAPSSAIEPEELASEFDIFENARDVIGSHKNM